MLFFIHDIYDHDLYLFWYSSTIDVNCLAYYYLLLLGRCDPRLLAGTG